MTPMRGTPNTPGMIPMSTLPNNPFEILYEKQFDIEEGRTIFLSRHGESEYNVEDRIGGDSNLTPRGQLYARALGTYMNATGNFCCVFHQILAKILLVHISKTCQWICVLWGSFESLLNELSYEPHHNMKIYQELSKSLATKKFCIKFGGSYL